MKKYTRVLFLVCSICCLLSFCVAAQKVSLKKIQKQQQYNVTYSIINELSSDAYEGREPGTSGYAKAADYVEVYLKKLGIVPYFPHGYKDTLVVYGDTTYNIVGFIPATKPTNDYILVGAHLDHIGKRDNAEDSVYNGANDNATGVAAVLQIAQELQKYKFSKHIIIALFSAEELGLHGSKHIASKLHSQKINLQYVINVDMIGAPLEVPNTVSLTGFHMTNMASTINSIVGYDFIVPNPYEESQRLFRRSDNYPFYNKFGIPSHTITTYSETNFEYYHHHDDEMEKIDVAFVHDAINKLTFAVIQMLLQNSQISTVNKTN